MTIQGPIYQAGASQQKESGAFRDDIFWITKNLTVTARPFLSTQRYLTVKSRTFLNQTSSYTFQKPQP